MELTEEQYQQAARYVDGEMEKAEQSAFEAVLSQNHDLLREVDAFQELRLLGESIGQKITVQGFPGQEEKPEHDKVWDFIKNARENWENDNTGKTIAEPGMNAAPSANTESPKKNVTRIIRLRFAAAAITIGFISLAASWWFSQNKNNSHDLALAKVKQISTGGKKEPKQLAPANADTTVAPVSAEPNRSLTSEPANIRRHETVLLAKRYFVADTLPSETFTALEKPGEMYLSNRHKEAIAEYNKVVESLSENPEPVTRGLNNDRIVIFLSHYYAAQSYFLIDDPAAAKKEIQNALRNSPGGYWEKKCQWYLALAYVQTQETKAGKKLLNQISLDRDAGIYQGKALALSQELENH